MGAFIAITQQKDLTEKGPIHIYRAARKHYYTGLYRNIIHWDKTKSYLTKRQVASG